MTHEQRASNYLIMCMVLVSCALASDNLVSGILFLIIAGWMLGCSHIEKRKADR